MQKHTALVFAATVLLITLAGACSSDRDSGTREVSASSLQEAERYLIDSLGETYYTALSCVLDKFPESLAYDFSAWCDVRTSPSTPPPTGACASTATTRTSEAR